LDQCYIQRFEEKRKYRILHYNTSLTSRKEQQQLKKPVTTTQYYLVHSFIMTKLEDEILDTKTISDCYSHNDPFGVLLIETCNSKTLATFRVTSGEIAIPNHLQVLDPQWDD
jgi:hypothetical protein